MLQLSGQYYYTYDLDNTGPADAVGETPASFGTHKMVIATASLNSKEDHKGGVGRSMVGFIRHTQDGNVQDTPQMPGAFVGANVSNLHWGFIVVGCHARASLVVMTFD